MYYETASVTKDNALAQFMTIRLRDRRIVFGPLVDEDRVTKETAKLNGRTAARVALAVAAGRHVFAQAMINPNEGHGMVTWAPLQGGGEITKFDGVWWATVTQAPHGGMYELQLYYNAKQVGDPVLAQSAEHAKQMLFNVYATRGMS